MFIVLEIDATFHHQNLVYVFGKSGFSRGSR